MCTSLCFFVCESNMAISYKSTIDFNIPLVQQAMHMASLLQLAKSIQTNIMHIHILGICGTFMGGIAVLAKAAGHKVTGSDANVYPPMSTQLEAQGIEL